MQFYKKLLLQTSFLPQINIDDRPFFHHIERSVSFLNCCHCPSENSVHINIGDSVFFPDCYKFDNNIVDQIVEMNDKLTSLKL